MLKCIKCGKENIYSADYCSDCRYHFNETEQKTAKKKTFVGKLEWIEDKYETWTLKKLLGKKWIKIISFIVLILFNAWLFYNDNKDFKLLESSTYQIEHKVNTNEYYLHLNEDFNQESIGLELYAPKRMKKLIIQRENNKQEIIETIDYNPKNKLTLNINGKNDYYLFNITYDNNKIEQIKIYVYGGM